jgi:hypothetical protein
MRRKRLSNGMPYRRTLASLLNRENSGEFFIKTDLAFQK